MVDIRTGNFGLLALGAMAAGVGFVLYQRLAAPTVVNLLGGNR
jgi:hypothetical protein